MVRNSIISPTLYLIKQHYFHLSIFYFRLTLSSIQLLSKQHTFRRSNFFFDKNSFIKPASSYKDFSCQSSFYLSNDSFIYLLYMPFSDDKNLFCYRRLVILFIWRSDLLCLSANLTGLNVV